MIKFSVDIVISADTGKKIFTASACGIWNLRNHLEVYRDEINRVVQGKKPEVPFVGWRNK